MHKTTKGIFFMLTHCVALALIMAVMRELNLSGLPASLIMFWQNIFALIMVFSWCAYLGHFPKTKKIKLHIARSVSGYSSGTLLTIGLGLIPLNSATAISFTGPLFTTLFAVVLLKEKISSHRVVGLLIGFAGVMVVLRPGTHHFDPAFFYIIATAMLWGVTDIIIKTLSRTDSLHSMLFYTILVSMVIATPLAIYDWKPINNYQLGLLAALAAFHLMNFGCASQAYRFADLSVLMPFEFSRLIFSSIFAYFIFGELLDEWIVLGASVIMFGAVYVVYKEKRKVKIYESEF